MTDLQATRFRIYLPRVLLGAIFVFSGLNGFFRFLPDPLFSPAGESFIGTLKASGFWWPLLKTVELVGGALLIFGSVSSLGIPMAAHLGALVLAPVTVAILWFHLALSPVQNAYVGYLAFVLEFIVIVAFWRNFKRVFHTFHTSRHPR